jgi:bacteriorhodopsin
LGHNYHILFLWVVIHVKIIPTGYLLCSSTSTNLFEYFFLFRTSFYVSLDCFSMVLFIFFDILLQPNAATEDDVTPLLSAVAAGSLACLELLVQVSPSSNYVL